MMKTVAEEKARRAAEIAALREARRLAKEAKKPEHVKIADDTLKTISYEISAAGTLIEE